MWQARPETYSDKWNVYREVDGRVEFKCNSRNCVRRFTTKEAAQKVADAANKNTTGE